MSSSGISSWVSSNASGAYGGHSGDADCAMGSWRSLRGRRLLLSAPSGGEEAEEAVAPQDTARRLGGRLAALAPCVRRRRARRNRSSITRRASRGDSKAVASGSWPTGGERTVTAGGACAAAAEGEGCGGARAGSSGGCARAGSGARAETLAVLARSEPRGVGGSARAGSLPLAGPLAVLARGGLPLLWLGGELGLGIVGEGVVLDPRGVLVSGKVSNGGGQLPACEKLPKLLLKRSPQTVAQLLP